MPNLKGNFQWSEYGGAAATWAFVKVEAGGKARVRFSDDDRELKRAMKLSLEDILHAD